jgi:hypothetical protein
MTNYTLEFKSAVEWAKRSIDQTQRQFKKNPNANNWNECLRALFVYQQLEYAVRSNLVARDALLDKLAVTPLGGWGDAICIATVGTPVKQSLQDFAVV